jgi:hypothetical protein
VASALLDEGRMTVKWCNHRWFETAEARATRKPRFHTLFQTPRSIIDGNDNRQRSHAKKYECCITSHMNKSICKKIQKGKILH